MKNFIFISPNFPEAYWKFCYELRKNGMRVLGIGDCPYDQLKQELRDSLHEYYLVPNLENYDDVFKAVAFFTYKYGKIDWLESNNEYWLFRDAQLRTEFNINTGFKNDEIEHVKLKSSMKAYYAKAGIPTARYHLVDTYEASVKFANEVGYPVVVKPDNGVGASHTYKLKSDDEVKYFFATKDQNSYIMEECVNGHVETYDAIIGAEGQPLFESGNVTPWSLMDIVNNQGDSIYYIVKELDPKIKEAGLRTVKAFGVKSRFVHLEFFVLDVDQPALGKKGDVIGLEVNMRPAGGFTPDMYNYAYETDVYKIWADMICFNKNTMFSDRPTHFCAFAGRRDGRNFRLDDNSVVAKYRRNLKQWGRMPDALSNCMANMMFLAIFDTKEEMDAFYEDVLAVK